MMASLSRLLEDIHPSRTYDAIQRRVDEAVNRFHGAPARVDDEEGFRNVMVTYFVLVDGAALGTERRWIDPPMDWSRCRELLERRYGADGAQAAAQRSIHGVEGGLRQVLADVADAYVELYGDNMVAAYVAEFWIRLTIPEKMAASREYIARWGRFLPPDVTENDAPRMLAYFPRFLEAHPKMLRALSRAGRR